MSSNSESKVWLVTGASSGFGKSVVEYALAHGDKVSATARRPSALDDLTAKYPASQLIVLPLEVTDPSAIATVFANTVDAFGRIDIVYNNAGYGVFSEVEATPDDVARGQFEVNFWGAVNVSREAVRVFRDVNKPTGGRLLQASSNASLIVHPLMAYYSASKWALEGFSEALSKELDPSWNIKIILLQIGSFATNAAPLALQSEIPIHSAYAQLPPGSTVRATREYLATQFVDGQPGDPDKAGREIYNIGLDGSIEVLHIPFGQDALSDAQERVDHIKDSIEQTAKFSLDLKRSS
ncbi:hypothetical protein D9619_001900 [Psilocybe cf. subviscida]|uniref:Uncharacterized protein n=1 Tax=Psilocybe cf. subviscida TaxID=2480587 RepID=A0A8H5BFU0_9AGAR|nr:hypothetical protein D9619_001900 [Psilocybe cf. subviscida]